MDLYYIGSHKGEVNDGYIGSGIYFKRAYNKNPTSFKREILYNGYDYLELEEFILKTLDAMNDKKMYNLKNDAVGGWEHIYSNIELVNKKNRRISESKKGKVFKHLEYDKNGVNNPMFNKKHTEESKIKMSNSRLGKCYFSKKIIERTENKIFDSITDCAKYHNINQSTMSVLIRNKMINRGNCKNKIFDYV